MRGALAGFTPRRRNQARLSFGAECQGGLEVSGTQARVEFGAECQGGLGTDAKVSFGAECQGGLETRAVLSFGAECGGYLEVDEAEATYPNGYKHFLEFLIPEDSIFVSTQLNNYLGSISETLDVLKSVDDGGLVEHVANGYDMRLETSDGTVIPFARPLWSPTTGQTELRWLKAAVPKAVLRLRLWFGKTVTTDGANEGATYATHLMAPNMRTGADRTGLSRTWTPTAITAGTLAGFAATFNGTTSQLVRVNPTELNGLSSITIQALVQLSSIATDKPIFIAGPNTGSTFGLFLRFRVSDGRLVFTIQVGASTTTVESPDGVMPAVGVPMLVAATWTSGQAPKLFAGGELVTLAVPGTSLTGTTNATLGAAASEALIGYNRNSGNRWAGQIADLMVSARVISEAYFQTQELNLLTPRDFYGIGEANSASQTNLSPVLPPIRTTATVGVTSEVDPALLAYEGDAGQTKTLEAHTGSDGGTYTTVGGRARGSFSSAGTFRSQATVNDSVTPPKRSTAGIIWAVSASSADPKAAIPFASVPSSKALTVGWTGHGGASKQYDTLEAAYTAAKAIGGGVHISLNDGTYSGSKTFNGTFPDADPIVIRSRNVANGHTPLAILSGQVNVTGPSHWLTELRWTYRTNEDPNGALKVSSHHTRITRNWFHTWNGVYFVDTTACHDQWLGWNRFASTRDPTIGPFQGNGAARANFVKILLNAKLITPTSRHYNTRIYRNYFKDNGNKAQGDDDSHHIYIGNSKADNGAAGYIAGCVIEWNLVDTGSKGHQRCFYLKRGIEYLQFNHIKAGGLFGFRHGSKRYGTDQTPTDFTGRMWGNRIGNSSYVILSGSGIDVRGNVITSPQGIRGFSGNQNPGSATVAGLYQACSDLLLAGNTVTPNGTNRPYNIGYHESGDILNEAQGGKVRNVQILGHAGKVPISLTGINNVIFDTTHVMQDTFAISESVGSLTIPSAPTLTEMDVGFGVAGQGPP